MEMLILFGAIIVGIKLGWDARERHASRSFDILMNKIHDEQQEEEENRIYITIEKHEGMFFVYNKHTSQFMAQANNRGELEIVLDNRYPGKKFAASPEHLRLLDDSI